MAYTRALLGLAAATAGVSSIGAEPLAAQRVFAPAGRWTVDFGEARCSLVRRLGGPKSPIVILSSWLGRDEPQLLVLQDGDEPLPDFPSDVRVILSPGGEAEDARVRREAKDQGRAVAIEGLKEGFIDRFSSAQAVRIQSGNRMLLTLATPQANRAVSVLKSCNEDLLRSWGVDTAAQARFTRQARHSRGSINNSDYPGEALRAGQQGVVVVAFTIGTDGAVSGCRTVVSSKVASLDAVSCELITSRFKYEPALDAQGKPVATGQVRTITWRGGSD